MNNLISLYEDSDIFIQAEIVNKDIIIHSDVYNFSPSRMKRFYYIWNAVKEMLKEVGVTVVYAPLMGDDTQEKWMEAFGFRPCNMKIVYSETFARDAYFCEV